MGTELTELIRQLYEAYSRELYLYLRALCGSSSLAEDLMQDTFLKAILSLPPGHGNMRAWLYMVGRNLYLNHRKKQKREVPMEDRGDPPSRQELLEKILSDERKRVLYAALSRLEPRKREVLLLQYFSGLSQKEIGAVMHLTPENVRVLACRGRQELKKLMEENHYDLS